MDDTLELTLERRWPKADYTIGALFVDGTRFHETLEPPDRGLTADMPTNKIRRIKSSYPAGKTAIPKGRYLVDMNTVSPRFKNRIWAKKYNGIVPRLVAVLCWSGELIHPGNTVDNTLSCVLVGENKVKGRLVKSVETFYKLMDDYLVPASAAGKKIYITIK